MSRRRLSWGEGPPEALPKRPYRDTVIVNLCLAGAIVVVAWLTGGDVRYAILIAASFFAIATAWSFRVWRRKLREEETKRSR